MDHLLTCILNGKADSHRTAEAQALVCRAAAEHGWEARILLSRRSDFNLLAEQARNSGGLVVAGGGAGTIATVAAALAGKNAILGVLPMGPSTTSLGICISRSISKTLLEPFLPARLSELMLDRTWAKAEHLADLALSGPAS